MSDDAEHPCEAEMLEVLASLRRLADFQASGRVDPVQLIARLLRIVDGEREQLTRSEAAFLAETMSLSGAVHQAALIGESIVEMTGDQP